MIDDTADPRPPGAWDACGRSNLPGWHTADACELQDPGSAAEEDHLVGIWGARP